MPGHIVTRWLGCQHKIQNLANQSCLRTSKENLFNDESLFPHALAHIDRLGCQYKIQTLTNQQCTLKQAYQSLPSNFGSAERLEFIPSKVANLIIQSLNKYLDFVRFPNLQQTAAVSSFKTISLNYKIQLNVGLKSAQNIIIPWRSDEYCTLKSLYLVQH